MARKTGQTKNRYTFDGLRLFRLLRTRVARPIAILLSLLFIFTSAAFAYTELHVELPSQRNIQSDLSSLDDNHELSSRPIESRELRSGRENSENSCTPKLDIKLPRSQIRLTCLFTSEKSFIALNVPSLFQASSCEAPFSPRPPPVSATQG